MKSSHLGDPPSQSEQAEDVVSGHLHASVMDPLVGLPEQVNVLAQGKSCRVERIVSHGHQSPPDYWYDQTEHEFVLVVSGAAELTIEGTPPRRLGPGDWMLLPARVRHRVEWTHPSDPTVWLAVFWQA